MEKPVPKRYTITSALPYANGPLHAGHLAGAYLPADIYTRYLKSCGKEVLFICGTDEHGVAISLRARKEGLTPQQVVDKYYEQFKKTFDAFGINFDIFSRTSLPIHHQTAQEFFTNFHKNNLLIEKTSQQFYDPKENIFLADRYIIGTCPKCNYEKAYGDQCEKCGSSLSPDQLINPKSSLSGTAPELKETKHWYFPLDKFQQQIENYILKEHPDWKPNVLGQCKSWLTEGLQPRAITRDSDWGIPVPLEGAEGKVLYVWFDAPIGYISATKHWATEVKKNPDAWKPFWLKKESNGETQLIHFIGKDNIVFHCIIFPAMLIADGRYILAENVPANEFLNLEGEKFSTSRNWAVWLDEYLEDFKDVKNHVDALRYVLCSTMPESKDNDFTWKDFQARVNNELVAILGNFVNRVLTLTHKYFEGKVPDFKPINEISYQWFPYTNFHDKWFSSADSYMLSPSEINPWNEVGEELKKCLETFRFKDALGVAMNFAREGNKFLQNTQPWRLFEEHPDKCAMALNTALRMTAYLVQLIEPFLPNTAKKLTELLGFPSDTKPNEVFSKMIPGHQLKVPVLLFDKIEDEMIEKQIQKLKSPTVIASETKQSQQPIKPSKEQIDYETFTKMDIRIATVLTAEKVPKTDKLLKLTIDTGLDTRTIVSGIAEHYDPQQLIGKQITILANLQPRKIKGIESQGMILMSKDENGKMFIIQPENQIDNGAVVE